MTTTICSMKKLLGFCLFCSCLTLLACGGKADSGDGFRVRGVNLGGWLVVEGWTKPSLFSDIPNKDLLDGTFLRLKSVKSGKYLCPEKNGERVVLRDANNTFNPIFRLWRINETTFNFRLHDKRFLGLRNGSPCLSHASKSAGPSETFEISRHHHNSTQIRIKASNGFFLQVNNKKGHVTADCEGDSDWGNHDPSVFVIESVRQLDGEYQVTNGYGPIIAPKIMWDHWNTFITEEDFKFMSRNGINTVRIPVGWWIAKGPTPPAPYVGGSLQLLDKAFSWALKHELKVIVDLHAAPGSQTGSTVSSSRDGFMEWGETEENIQETVAIIDFLTARYAKHPSLYAVELLNEPLFPDVSLEKLTNYYRAGYYAVRNHSSTAYVLLSNRLGWNPADPRELLPISTELKGSVIDVHYYHMFMEIFKSMNFKQNVDYLYTNVSTELNQLSTPNGPLVFVGEWATDWATAGFANATKEDYQTFSKAQLEVYGRATFGWAYWTFKCELRHFSMEWMITNGYINSGSLTGVSSDASRRSGDTIRIFSKLSADILKLQDKRILALLNLIGPIFIFVSTFCIVS
ncbi:hypothetical protein RHSIM_Rhsim07G0200700 [Rhododendron simsii]|uniref:Mannan endo-1,4-beta-mannosidase n=1 Tax=Rhododendron simsii TaxID=118357 RepID=A0A834GPN7_RHOSS|nr:hypothetical protein RHSIM_Rhsim07G0200700 [Rhododendron simsii]